jgi:hypothetical protein
MLDHPPLGRSFWRKKIKDGARRGVKAKTIYPTHGVKGVRTVSGPFSIGRLEKGY